jgi:hypothetical protein
MNWNCRFAAALGAFVLLAVTTALDAQTAIARPWRMTAESQQDNTRRTARHRG